MNNVLTGTHPTVPHVVFSGVDEEREVGAIKHTFENISDRLPHASLGLERLDFNAESGQEILKVTPRPTAAAVANEDLGTRYEGSNRYLPRGRFLGETIIWCCMFEDLKELVKVVNARNLDRDSTAVDGIEEIVKSRRTSQCNIRKGACLWIATIRVEP